MKKILLTVFVLCASMIMAQSLNWQFIKNFPDDVSLKKGTGAHGIAVSPNGLIWVQLYAVTDSIPGVTQKVRVVYVYNPDVSQTLFSPIKMVTVGGVTDTLWNSGRGATIDNMGRPSFSYFDKVYTLNYEDGSGYKAVIPFFNNTLDAPAYDGEGYLYTSHVLAGCPVKIFDADYNFQTNAMDTLNDIGRTMAVSQDGLTMFLPRFTGKYTLKLTRASKFDPFVVSPDTAWVGACVQTLCWHPVNKDIIYMDAGTYFDKPADTVKYKPNMFYGYNYKTMQRVDSIMWNFTVPYSDAERTRALGFSPDGQYAYLGGFSADVFPSVQVQKRIGGFVNSENGVAKDFKLAQNFPNPFNPSTKIEFSIVKEGVVTLKVFNSLGQEVSTLVNESLKAGNYSTHFTGKNLPTGTYVYQLITGGQAITKKMLLVK